MGETGSWWRDPVGWGLALWGAAVAVLGFPPAPVWPLALAAPAPLWASVLNTPPRRGLARGWLYGLGFFCGLLWWIAPTVVRYGALPIPAGVACVFALASYLALYPAACAVAVAAVSRRSPALALALAPLAWTALEGLRGVALSGFPWGDLPQALWRVNAALRLAPWVGIDGVRLLAAGLASGLAWALCRMGGGARLPVRALTPCGLAAATWVVLGALPPPLPPPAGRVRVAVVQGNIDQAQKWDPAYRAATLKIYEELSRAVAATGQGGRVDLVLWPETAVPLYAQNPSPERLGLERFARDIDSYLAFGAPAYVRRPGGVEYRNAVFLMNPQGRLVGRYDKVHLVPFGEYVPFGHYFPFLKKLVHGVGDFTPGEGVVPLSGNPGLPALGPLVCFEAIFPALAAEHAARGAQVLAVVTNDGWFGTTPGPYQHLAFAAWRAAETGLPLVRAANTGVSAAFDSRGHLLRATPLRTRDAFAVTLSYPPPHRTPMMRVRPWVAPIAGFLAALGLFVILVGRRRAGPAANPPA